MITIKILNIFLILVIFFSVKWIIFQFTDKKGLPMFLDYKPYHCYKCCSFWVLSFIYIGMIYVTSNWFFIVGNLITFLDAIAKYIDENNRFIK